MPALGSKEEAQMNFKACSKLLQLRLHIQVLPCSTKYIFLLCRQPSFIKISHFLGWTTALLPNESFQTTMNAEKITDWIQSKTTPHTVINTVQMEPQLLYISSSHQSGSKLRFFSIQRRYHLWLCSFTNVFWSMACESVSHTQVVVEEVEEHQHAAAHDYKHTDHDGGDVNRLFVLLLCGLVPLQFKVASGGTTNDVNQRSLLGVHHPGAVSKPPEVFSLSLNSIQSELVSCQSSHGDHQRYLPPAVQLAGHNSFLPTLQNTQPVLQTVFRLRPCASQKPSDCALALALHQGGRTWTE